MKIKVNSKVIAGLNPCQDRHNNWLKYYSSFNDNITAFLDLSNISHSDKIWVCVRVMPIFLVEVFAIDCAVRAHDYAANAAAYAAYADAADAAAYAANAAAAYYAAYAANAAAYAAAYNERQQQIESLIYLINSYKEPKNDNK